MPLTTNNNLLRAALDYAKRRWLKVPPHSPTAKGCSCGRDAVTAVALG
jgi:hypothetical protein